jgi:2-hydroxy-6-oxonona-2,4-dienedioate hydrolase
MKINYLSDIRRARARVATGSRILRTARGPIEYAEAGTRDGPPLLVIHGAGGGFDQGIDLAAGLKQRGFRIIAVSRFGYLRTPLPADASPAAQADAHAAVLDALHIPRCAVLGASAGGPSAMQLALRHPDRVTALVLMVPAVWAPRGGAMPRRMSALAGAAMNLALRSDFLFWLALRFAPQATLRTILGTPPELLTHAEPAERARVQVVMDHILPVSRRRRGLLTEAAIVPPTCRASTSSASRYPRSSSRHATISIRHSTGRRTAATTFRMPSSSDMRRAAICSWAMSAKPPRPSSILWRAPRTP